MGDSESPTLIKLVNGTYLPVQYICDEERLQEVLNMKVYEDDVYIVTYPKSGTTWMQALVSLLCSGPKDASLPYRHQLVNDISYLEYLNDKVNTLHNLENVPRPRHIKSHLPFEFLPLGCRGANPPKLIYVGRNPKDVCVSFFHFTRDFPQFGYNGSFEDFYKIFKAGKVIYGVWLSHVQSFWNERHRENILFVTYEEMQQDLAGVMHRVAAFLGRPALTLEQVAQIVPQLHFDNMKQDPYFSLIRDERAPEKNKGSFLRKGITGDWMNHMTPDMASEMDCMFLNPMEELGLVFE